MLPLIADDPTAPIDSFKQEYRFLSNFWPCRVFLAPHWYGSVEHAYQAAKTTDLQAQLAIRSAQSAGMAKRLGKSVPLRPDWEKIKLEVMGDLLWQKFVLDHKLRARLVATGQRQLIEGNTWGDRVWGVCGGQGTNHLGNLLMRIRAIAAYIVDNQPKDPDGSYDDGQQPAND